MKHYQMFETAIFLNVVMLAAVLGSPYHVLEPRQSSDGCGPNPLVAVMSYAREFADFSPHQLMRFIETDTRAGNQMRSLLRSYDDCVRTGDGTRYKRPSSPEVMRKSPTESGEPEANKMSSSWGEDIQAWKRLLKALVPEAN